MIASWRPRAVVVVGLVLALTAATRAGAQDQRIVVTGIVQWIAGNKMVVAADNGASVTIDLARADQTSYNTLRGGDRVVVTGVVSPRRDRLIAEDIRADTGGYNPYDQWSNFQQAP